MVYRSTFRHRRFPRARTTADWVWRKEVLQRCNYTCDISLSTGVRLEAHHLNCFAVYPDERFDPDNGVALTVREHILFHEWMGGIWVPCTREDYERYKPQRIRESLILC